MATQTIPCSGSCPCTLEVELDDDVHTRVSAAVAQGWFVVALGVNDDGQAVSAAVCDEKCLLEVALHMAMARFGNVLAPLTQQPKTKHKHKHKAKRPTDPLSAREPSPGKERWS